MHKIANVADCVKNMSLFQKIVVPLGARGDKKTGTRRARGALQKQHVLQEQRRGTSWSTPDAEATTDNLEIVRRRGWSKLHLYLGVAGAVVNRRLRVRFLPVTKS